MTEPEQPPKWTNLKAAAEEKVASIWAHWEIWIVAAIALVFGFWVGYFVHG